MEAVYLSKDQALEILRGMAEEFSAMSGGENGGQMAARIGQAYNRAADLVARIEPETIKRRRSRKDAGDGEAPRRRGRPAKQSV